MQLYGMDEYHKLFTPRQLVALTTFSDLVHEARKRRDSRMRWGRVWRMTMCRAGLCLRDPCVKEGAGRGLMARRSACIWLLLVDKVTDHQWNNLIGLALHGSGQPVTPILPSSHPYGLGLSVRVNPFPQECQKLSKSLG